MDEKSLIFSQGNNWKECKLYNFPSYSKQTYTSSVSIKLIKSNKIHRSYYEMQKSYEDFTAPFMSELGVMPSTKNKL